ncbi:MAG: hypothetical protein ABI811_14430 [Acidobacteriota bacterium]
MPWNVLLFPLIGGYLFVNVCNLFKYRTRRCEGERLLLECALYGVLSLFVARILIVASHQITLAGWNLGDHLQGWLHALIADRDAPYLGTGISALAVGVIGAKGVNLVFRWLGDERMKRHLLRRYKDDALMFAFHEAMFNSYPLSLTFTNRKVYIGWILEPPSESPQDRYFTLLLLLSGYRQKDTLDFIPSVNYADRTRLAEDGTKEDLIFTILLKIDDVVSANPFDQAIYDEQFVSKKVSQ